MCRTTHCVEQGKSVVIFLLFSQPTLECCSNIVLSLACCLTGGRELGAVQEQLWHRHRPRPDHVRRQQYYCPDPWTLLAHSSPAQAQCFVRPFHLPILQLIEWSLTVDPGPNTVSADLFFTGKVFRKMWWGTAWFSLLNPGETALVNPHPSSPSTEGFRIWSPQPSCQGLMGTSFFWNTSHC